MDAAALRTTHNSVNAFQPNSHVSCNFQGVSDEDLLRQCAQGTHTAFEEMVRRYQPSLTRLLTRLLASPDEVEEALSTLFLRAWQYAPRFQYRASVATWLYRIAKNIAYDIGKQRRNKPLQLEAQQADRVFSQGNAEDDALRHLEQEERASSLQRALDQLSPGDRLILVLYYYEQMEYPQIQAITQLSYPVLKTRFTRARRRLRELLEKSDTEQADELS